MDGGRGRTAASRRHRWWHKAGNRSVAQMERRNSYRAAVCVAVEFAAGKSIVNFECGGEWGTCA